MLDTLKERFKRSQPWKVIVGPGVIEAARKQIEDLYAPGPVRIAWRGKLDAYLATLEADPLAVLGHPPLGTDDPHAFRYSADPQAAISVVANLDLGRHELAVVLLKIKGGSHGRH